MSKKYKMHVCTTGELYSFRLTGSDMTQRECVFTAHRYGDGPDAVLTTYGIQGAGYFECIHEHYEEVFKNVYAIQGYVWLRHLNIYKRVCKGIMDVQKMWRGKPYGADGPEFVWVITRKLDENGKVVGPKALWDKEEKTL